MQEEKWALGQAGATVRLEAGLGVIEVRGLVCNRALERLHEGIGTWAARCRPAGYAMVLDWSAVLTANGPREVMACLRGTTGAAARLPAAIIVPPERLKWAAKHCLQLGEHGLCRAAFSERERALVWLRALASTSAAPPSSDSRSPSSASRETAPSSRRRRISPAARQTHWQAGGLGSLSL